MIDQFSPRALQVLLFGLRAAEKMGDRVLHHEHVLLGLVAESRAIGIPAMWETAASLEAFDLLTGSMNGDVIASTAADESIYAFTVDVVSAIAQHGWHGADGGEVTPDDLAMFIFRVGCPPVEALMATAGLSITGSLALLEAQTRLPRTTAENGSPGVALASSIGPGMPTSTVQAPKPPAAIKTKKTPSTAPVRVPLALQAVGLAPVTAFPAVAVAPMLLLTVAHRCDSGSCGAQARAVVTLGTGSTLIFCRHHTEALRVALESAGAVIATQYGALTGK